MKVLQLCQDLFDGPPDGSVKALFEEKRAKYADDHRFFGTVIQWLGGRGYNKFLDYKLFAVKFITIVGMEEFCRDIGGTDAVTERDSFAFIKEATEYLFFDDRHDLYQNLPYSIDDIINTVEESKRERFKVSFMSKIVTAMIECINVHGTGDIIHKHCITED